MQINTTARIEPAPTMSALTSKVRDSSDAAASRKGSLSAEVLSAYDLPYSEPPVRVTLSTNTTAMVLKSGPPLARHKNRNSFRFSAPGNSAPSSPVSTTASAIASASGATDQPIASSTLNMIAPLRDLYKATATIRVEYKDKMSLETTYELKQLRIGESKWLILNLAPSSDNRVLTTEDEIPPTIRVKMTLSGPFRPEIAALVSMGKGWFGLIDGMEHNAKQVWSGVPKPPFDVSKYMVVPAVPVLAALVVASPLIAGAIMVGLPFLLPVVLLAISIAATVLLVGASVLFSTRIGRDHVGGLMAPLIDSLLSSRAGQTLIYDTGPRPTPVSVAKQVLPTSFWGKLIISLLIDLTGSASYLLPVVGEGLDIAWAPIQTILIMAMYDTITPNLKYVSFFEEILPFTDIVPTASIGFMCEFVPQLLGQNPEWAQAVNGLAEAAAAKGVMTKRD